jgi:hypothetical protein
VARAGVLPQRAEHGGGDRAGPDCLNTTHGHARVLGLDDHAYPSRLKVLVEPVTDLLGQPLLYLGSPGKVLNDAGQLGEPENALAWQVPDVRGPGERQQVMASGDSAQGWP